MKKGLEGQSMKPQMGMPTREKYWSELDEAGKIERLREYAQQVEDLRRRVISLENKLEQHEHINGKIVMPLIIGGNYQNQTIRGPYEGCWGCEECRNKTRI